MEICGDHFVMRRCFIKIVDVMLFRWDMYAKYASLI